jgi:hypothetical protein
MHIFQLPIFAFSQIDTQSGNNVLIFLCFLPCYCIQVRVVRRDNGLKVDIPAANLVEEVKALLDEIQANLLKTAKEKRDACIEVIHTWDEFTTALNNKRLILAPWCDEEVLHDLFYIYCLSDLPSVMNQFFETLVTIN